MRKIVVAILVVSAFLAGMFVGVRAFIYELAGIHGVTPSEFVEWYQQQKQRQKVMKRFN